MDKIRSSGSLSAKLMMPRLSYWTLLCAVLLSTISICYGEKNYTDYKLLGVYASSIKELRILQDSRLENEVDFWNEPAKLFEKISVLVPPDADEKFTNLLYSNGIDYFVYNDNIQQSIENERTENNLGGKQVWPFELNIYHNLDGIMNFIDQIPLHYSKLASIVFLGSSVEGNSIKGIKVSSGGTEKPAIWIDAGIHSREWVAPSTAMYILYELVSTYNTSTEAKELVDAFDWYIFPMVNPDGYKYSWTQDRMWRKNRAPSKSPLGQCKGVDLNRNFDTHFGGAGTSDDQCSNIYRGRTAFSEPESRAIRDGVLKISNRLKAYITIHSYSQLWMCPYGHSESRPKDYNDMIQGLNSISSAVYSKHYEWYKTGTVSRVIYRATGSSVDWAYDTVGVKYSYVVELRDKGRYGFLLPRDQIIPTSEETYEGIKALASHIKKKL